MNFISSFSLLSWSHVFDLYSFQSFYYSLVDQQSKSDMRMFDSFRWR